MKKMMILLAVLSFNLLANTKDLAFKNRTTKWAFPAGLDTFNQKIDHNNPLSKTFKQRYWDIADYATNAHSPVILYICGEATCYGPGSATLQLASQLGAHVFALEHRYYGQSYPVPNLETKNLAFLTIEMALADLVNFKRSMQDKLGLTGSWISVGGSYAGALSAYLRTTYPEDFVGALASSGPVKADLDFSEYDAHVAKMAGKECQQAILKVVAEVEKNIVSDEGFAIEKEYFGVKKLTLREDFLYLLADAAAGAVQYGLKDTFCNLVTTEGKDGYAQAVAIVGNYLGNLEDMSAQAAMDTNINTGQDVGMRQWFYQSCHEFGFWQNVNPDKNLRARSTAINADFHNQICQRLFSMDASSIEKTNVKYYEPILSLKNSNILFTNGEEDPWSNLSLLVSNNPLIISHMIKGAAHCDDLGGGGTEEVNIAKKLFSDLAKEWTKN